MTSNPHISLDTQRPAVGPQAEAVAEGPQAHQAGVPEDESEGGNREPAARVPRVPDPEPWVLESAAAGDREAARLLVGRYERMVYGVAVNVLGDAGEAEDAAQEAFLRVFRSLSRYRGESSFTTWVFRVAVNASLDQERRRRRGFAPPRDPEAALPLLTPGPEQTAEDLERCRSVLAAMRGLQPALRRPLVLREVYGLGYEEIGLLLGRPLGTVKAAVHRGRTALLAALDDDR
jgi:RNA polymerase sigma-70 factor (ECF subfamily)